MLVATTMRLARARPERSAQNSTGRTYFFSHALNEGAAGMPARSPAEQEELSELVAALAGLDRRRRRMCSR